MPIDQKSPANKPLNKPASQATGSLITPLQRWTRFVRYLALYFVVTVLVAYGAAAGWLWSRQESLLFRPQPLPADFVLSSAPDIAELTVDVPGARLSVLQLQLAAPKGVVFYLHGNAGNLERWFADADFYRRAGFDLVMMDYRGFGKSTGRIENQAQLLDDVRAVWAAVEKDYAGKRVVLFGRSLGTGLATALASELTAASRTPDLTVLVSPYSGMSVLATEKYPWLPGLSWFLRYPLPTSEWLTRVGGPVLIGHGDEDTLIPVAHARALHEAVPSTRLIIVPGGTHSNVQASAEFQEALSAALARL